jgi:hypothetical protein
MRWQQLFADLEAQFDEAETALEQAEAASRARAEVGAVSLVDRLGGGIGSAVVLRCRGAGRITGRLVEVGPDWFLLADEHGRETLLATAAVTAVGGLGRRTSPAGEGRPWVRTDLRRALRGLVRDRSAVRMTLDDGTVLTGTIDRIGADFAELAEHPVEEFRRASSVRSVQTVRLAAVATVVRLGDSA